jgi:serine protease Do
VIRGRIGVTVTQVPREDYQEFGLKTRSGAIVASVTSGGAAAKAGVEPGDVIVQYNGRPVTSSDELVKMVVGTKPGTSVPVRVLRNKQEKTLNLTVDELDLEAEQQSRGRRSPGQEQQQDDSQGAGGFGLTLDNVTPQMARRLGLPSGQSGAVVTDVEPDGPSAGRLQAGDVILAVNRRPVANATEAARALQGVQSGRIAQILVWRGAGEVFVTVKKD